MSHTNLSIKKMRKKHSMRNKSNCDFFEVSYTHKIESILK